MGGPRADGLLTGADPTALWPISSPGPLAATAGRSLRVAIDAVGIRGGGGATVLEEFLGSFRRIRPDWTITTFVLPEKCREFHLPIECHSGMVIESGVGDSWLGRLVWQNFALPQQLRRMQADVVFSIANSGAIHPALPQVLYLHQPNAFRGTPLCEVRSVQELRFWVIGILAKLSGRSSHAVIVQTEAMKVAVGERYPALRAKLVVIPGGVGDVARSEPSLGEVRQRLGGESGPVICYVSLPSAHKNHATLLAAWPLVREKIPGARLALTLDKDVPVPDPASRGGASLSGCSLGSLPAGVINLGVLSRVDVRSLYVCSDVMVFPSVAESFGLPLVEAMVEGCPVAASDLPYAHEVLGEAGVYFDPHSAESIAGILADLLSDNVRRKELIEIGVKRCYRYKADVIAERVALVLEAAAASGQTPK